jgi:hypothetical protein
MSIRIPGITAMLQIAGVNEITSHARKRTNRGTEQKKKKETTTNY